MLKKLTKLYFYTHPPFSYCFAVGLYGDGRYDHARGTARCSSAEKFDIQKGYKKAKGRALKALNMAFMGKHHSEMCAHYVGKGTPNYTDPCFVISQANPNILTPDEKQFANTMVKKEVQRVRKFKKKETETHAKIMDGCSKTTAFEIRGYLTAANSKYLSRTSLDVKDCIIKFLMSESSELEYDELKLGHVRIDVITDSNAVP